MSDQQSPQTQVQRDWQAEIAACTKSAQVIPIYADLIMFTTGPTPGQAPIVDINAAIMQKWARSTFVSIKQKAWKIVDKKVSEAHALKDSHDPA